MRVDRVTIETTGGQDPRPLTCVAMECPACGRTVASGDRFCNGCGTSLEGVTDTTQVVAVVDDDAAGTGPGTPGADPAAGTPVASTSAPVAHTDTDGDPEGDLDLAPTELLAAADGGRWDDEPAWAPTDQTPAVQPAGGESVTTTDLPTTEPITEVWPGAEADDAARSTPYDFAEREPVAVTGQIDAQPAPTAAMPAMPVEAAPEPTRFAFNLILVIALATGILSLIALFANVVTITSDARLVATPDTPPEFRTGTWIVDDLADNLSIAGLIAIVAMVAGGVAAGFHWRWGAGLAGGAGLAMAGISAIAVGLAQFPIDVAHAFARVPSDDPFVLTITRDLGYWLLVAAGALGVVLFFASINDALGDRRPGLNPWLAALGALAVVVAAAGPLIPENQALFSDNWYIVEDLAEPSALLLVGRLVQLALLLIGGVIGFLSVRRWGLGIAAGVSLPAVWLVVSTLFDITDRPVGLGFRNPGASNMEPHGVTIIGASAVLAMLILAVVGAYDQTVRERR